MAKKSSLERILHSQGFGTRKACRILVRHDNVTVNGEPCDNPFAEFDITNLHFTVYGESWQFREKVYLMLNKPAHYECSHKTIHHPSIYTLLPDPLIERDVQCIGRLDEDTTGLILLSDDGHFIHRMSSPKWKVPKIYEVHCKHPVSEADIQALLDGVQLIDEPAPLAALACKQMSSHILHMTLGEGKYHQVKRMIAAISNRVESLKRIQIGEIQLPKDLAEGEWRWLTEDELAALHQAPKH